jgi:hypothetical protein
MPCKTTYGSADHHYYTIDGFIFIQPRKPKFEDEIKVLEAMCARGKDKHQPIQLHLSNGTRNSRDGAGISRDGDGSPQSNGQDEEMTPTQEPRVREGVSTQENFGNGHIENNDNDVLLEQGGHANRGDGGGEPVSNPNQDLNPNQIHETVQAGGTANLTADGGLENPINSTSIDSTQNPQHPNEAGYSRGRMESTDQAARLMSSEEKGRLQDFIDDVHNPVWGTYMNKSRRDEPKTACLISWFAFSYSTRKFLRDRMMLYGAGERPSFALFFPQDSKATFTPHNSGGTPDKYVNPDNNAYNSGLYMKQAEDKDKDKGNGGYLFKALTDKQDGQKIDVYIWKTKFKTGKRFVLFVHHSENNKEEKKELERMDLQHICSIDKPQKDFPGGWTVIQKFCTEKDVKKLKGKIDASTAHAENLETAAGTPRAPNSTASGNSEDIWQKLGEYSKTPHRVVRGISGENTVVLIHWCALSFRNRKFVSHVMMLIQVSTGRLNFHLFHDFGDGNKPNQIKLDSNQTSLEDLKPITHLGRRYLDWSKGSEEKQCGNGLYLFYLLFGGEEKLGKTGYRIDNVRPLEIYLPIRYNAEDEAYKDKRHVLFVDHSEAKDTEKEELKKLGFEISGLSIEKPDRHWNKRIVQRFCTSEEYKSLTPQGGQHPQSNRQNEEMTPTQEPRVRAGVSTQENFGNGHIENNDDDVVLEQGGHANRGDGGGEQVTSPDPHPDEAGTSRDRMDNRDPGSIPAEEAIDVPDSDSPDQFFTGEPDHNLRQEPNIPEHSPKNSGDDGGNEGHSTPGEPGGEATSIGTTASADLEILRHIIKLSKKDYETKKNELSNKALNLSEVDRRELAKTLKEEWKDVTEMRVFFVKDKKTQRKALVLLPFSAGKSWQKVLQGMLAMDDKSEIRKLKDYHKDLGYQDSTQTGRDFVLDSGDGASQGKECRLLREVLEELKKKHS